jgi:hypothetical protein
MSSDVSARCPYYPSEIALLSMTRMIAHTTVLFRESRVPFHSFSYDATKKMTHTCVIFE